MIRAVVLWLADLFIGRPVHRSSPSEFWEQTPPHLVEKWLKDEVRFWRDAAAHTKNPDRRRRWLEIAEFYERSLTRWKEEHP